MPYFRSKTRDKKRCYLCSAYVVHMKQHLENTHVTDVFQCKVKNCFQPKFLEIVKVNDNGFWFGMTLSGADIVFLFEPCR